MNLNVKIIGISGKRESGKSSLAKALSKFGFHRVSLADPLKEMCKQLYGLTDNQVYGSEKEAPTQYKRTDGSYYTPRDILIREGCLKRSIDPNFWCRMLDEHIKYLSMDSTFRNFVIDDIRFLNEIRYFDRFDSSFVRLERDQNAIGKAALDDLSETELDTYQDWDFILIKELNRHLKDLDTFAEYIVRHV